MKLNSRLSNALRGSRLSGSTVLSIMILNILLLQWSEIFSALQWLGGLMRHLNKGSRGCVRGACKSCENKPYNNWQMEKKLIINRVYRRQQFQRDQMERRCAWSWVLLRQSEKFRIQKTCGMLLRNINNWNALAIKCAKNLKIDKLSNNSKLHKNNKLQCNFKKIAGNSIKNMPKLSKWCVKQKNINDFHFNVVINISLERISAFNFAANVISPYRSKY